MSSVVKATVLSLARNPVVVVWTVAFPILLASLFMFMFSGMGEDATQDPVPVAVVSDASWGSSPFLVVAQMLGRDGEALIDVIEAPDETSARILLASGKVDGVFVVDAQGGLRLTVAPAASVAHQRDGERSYEVSRSVLEVIATSYEQTRTLVGEAVSSDPCSFVDGGSIERALSAQATAERVSFTRSEPDETVRYYYALLGMAVLFSAQASLIAVAGIRPSSSVVAARRSVAGMSRMRQLVGAAVASWFVSFISLSVTFLFLRTVVGVDFAGREPLCFVGIAVGALLATGLGALVGSLPLRGCAGGLGVLMGLSCLLSLFAGLYGESSMALADELARSVPLSAWLNPAKLLCDLFHCLYFYESLAAFWMRLAACAAWGAALFALAILVFRRQSHASL